MREKDESHKMYSIIENKKVGFFFFFSLKGVMDILYGPFVPKLLILKKHYKNL